MTHHVNRLNDKALELALRLMPEHVAIDVSLHIKSMALELATQRSALLTVLRYFARCAQVWADEGGAVVNEEGHAIAQAEGLDELCNEAGEAVRTALDMDDATMAAEATQMRRIASAKPPTITAGELREAIVRVEPDDWKRAELPVRVWLPGSTISLGSAFMRDGEIHIEGNVDPGSALMED